MDEKPIPKGKKQVVEINGEQGVSTLKITLKDDKKLKSQRMIKPKTEVKKGQWFINKHVEKRKQPPSSSIVLIRTQKKKKKRK